MNIDYAPSWPLIMIILPIGYDETRGMAEDDAERLQVFSPLHKPYQIKTIKEVLERILEGKLAYNRNQKKLHTASLQTVRGVLVRTSLLRTCWGILRLYRVPRISTRFFRSPRKQQIVHKMAGRFCGRHRQRLKGRRCRIEE